MEMGIIKESDSKINFNLFQWKTTWRWIELFTNVFIKVNNYPPKLVNSMIKIELEENSSDQQEVTTYARSKQIQIVLLYAGKSGNNIIQKMSKN